MVTNKNRSIEDGLVSPDKYIQRCRRVLEKVLKRKAGLAFSSNELARNRELYVLSGRGATPAEAERSYNVVPFSKQRDLWFWLAVSLIFEFCQGRYFLMNISLIIFRGLASDVRKSVLLRAEWDAPEEGDQALHAQPHWHIYQSAVDAKAGGGQVSFRPMADITEVKSDTEPSYERGDNSLWNEADKFHFAMASRWHLDTSASHQEKIQLDGVLKWIEGCLGYVKREIHTLYS